MRSQAFHSPLSKANFAFEVRHSDIKQHAGGANKLRSVLDSLVLTQGTIL